MGWISSEDAFRAWAPDGVLWSEWAKPISFVHADGGIVAESLDASKLPSVPGRLDSDSVVVVDLPGAEAVYAGLSLAARGFRPIPVFNGTSGPSAVVDVAPITRALAGGAELLKRATLAVDAPPAFLLDSRRSVGTSLPRPGSYDNRWATLPQDFPVWNVVEQSGDKVRNPRSEWQPVRACGSCSRSSPVARKRFIDAGRRPDIWTICGKCRHPEAVALQVGVVRSQSRCSDCGAVTSADSDR